MRLIVWFTAVVGGPQVIWAEKPRSIIYAVILHEVCSALSSNRGASGRPPSEPYIAR